MGNDQSKLPPLCAPRSGQHPMIDRMNHNRDHAKRTSFARPTWDPQPQCKSPREILSLREKVFVSRPAVSRAERSERPTFPASCIPNPASFATNHRIVSQPSMRYNVAFPLSLTFCPATWPFRRGMHRFCWRELGDRFARSARKFSNPFFWLTAI